MQENKQEEKRELSSFELVQMRARHGKIWITLFTLALIFAFLEIFYVMNFYMTLSQFLEKIGLIAFTSRYVRALSISERSYLGIVMGLLVAIGFIAFPSKRPKMIMTKKETEEYLQKYINQVPVYDIILALTAIIVFAYRAKLGPYVEANEGALPPGSEPWAVLSTIIGFILVFELTRRTVGPWLTIVVGAFLAYYLYFSWHFLGLTLELTALKWSKDMFFSNYGLFNIPFKVMAMYVFAFLFFGTFLELIGIGEYITKLMLSLFGKRPGGPAKVAIVSSGFMGMLSGSSVANVFTTGVFTIPLMKKSGFPGEVAGAVEASASTGGQIMPPIMGAAAFIMASFLNRPYGEIVIAAFLPAFLYFLSLYFQIDLEAKRRGLKGLPEHLLPDKRPLIKKLYLLLPVVAITLLLVMRLPPQHSVVASLSIALIVALWAMEIPLAPKIAYTISLMILLAIALLVGMNIRAAMYFAGIFFLLASILLVFTKDYGKLGRIILRSIEQASRNSVPVFMAATLAGVVQGSLTLTGLSTQLGEKLVTIAHGNIYLLLLLAGILSIIVGMGVPTTANYVITSLLSAGAIVTAATTTLGLPEKAALLGAHMFVFYYGILADLTPPVALAAFAGATVARSDFWKTAVNATRFGFAKYVLPFVFAVNPALLVIPVMEGQMTFEQFIWSLITIAAVLIPASAAFAGYFGGKITNTIWRGILAIAGILAISGNPVILLISYIVSIASYIIARSQKLTSNQNTSNAPNHRNNQTIL